MGRKPTGNPMGRPKKKIDIDQFEKLCALQCTLQEICAFFDITDVTLNTFCKENYGTTFSEVFAIKRQAGVISLRRSQFKLAEKSAAMAIFLGKNMLGQTDKIEQTVMEVEDLSGLADMLRDNPATMPTEDEEAE